MMKIKNNIFLVGRGKHCSAEMRHLIIKLKNEGKTYKEIENIVGCSPTMIFNAIHYKLKPENRGGKLKTSAVDDRQIVRYATIHPFASAGQIKKELNLTISLQTLRRRLRENNLFARSPRKVPLLTQKHIVARMEFAKVHKDWPVNKWRNILWTDESKIVMFGGTGSREYVRRPPNQEFRPKFTKKTVKHGGLSIMIWACFSYAGVGPIHKIDGIMDKNVYVEILENTMLPYASWEMPLKWTFQQDNDPKHTSKHAKAWFASQEIDVMTWPAQSPDLNPIENLWGDVKRAVSIVKPINKTQLWMVVQQAWHDIPAKRCQDLIDSMPRRCTSVLQNKGYSTKY